MMHLARWKHFALISPEHLHFRFSVKQNLIFVKPIADYPALLHQLEAKPLAGQPKTHNLPD